MSVPLKGQIIVLADDWGRHPSSAQHLIRQLLPHYAVLWVNTVGMRRPRLSLADLRRALARIRPIVRPAGPPQPRVIAPLMYPGFRNGFQRRFNRSRLRRAITEKINRHPQSLRRIAVTTLPVAADLIGEIPVDRWVYYCVDDFSVWPGLDGAVLRDMEADLVRKVDAVFAASTSLAQRLAGMGRIAGVLTHGVDVAHWSAQGNTISSGPPVWMAQLARPVVLFWGLIDRRLDVQWCAALEQLGGSLVLVGPRDNPEEQLLALRHVNLPGAVGYEQLPGFAAGADVLVMPYADLPVTRAMQPLKFKEYLATGKPVVARKLPGVADWADAADLVETADDFVAAVRTRIAQGLPDAQRDARRRILDESWAAKAMVFERMLLDND